MQASFLVFLAVVLTGVALGEPKYSCDFKTTHDLCSEEYIGVYDVFGKCYAESIAGICATDVPLALCDVQSFEVSYEDDTICRIKLRPFYSEAGLVPS